jgi:hypothetical protein
MAFRTGIAAAVAICALGARDTRAEQAVRCRPTLARVAVDGRVVWCAASTRDEIVAPAVESEPAHAVAFAIRNAGVWVRLVVVLLDDEHHLHTMTWAVPSSSDGRKPTVTWLGAQRVGFGYSPLVPELVASWTVRD